MTGLPATDGANRSGERAVTPARQVCCAACAAWLLLFSPSCRTRAPEDSSSGIQRQYVGKTVRVNDHAGHIILKFVVLPSEGEELTMYRGDQKTGRVRVTRPIERPYAAADRLDGYLMRGDRAYREQTAGGTTEIELP